MNVLIADDDPVVRHILAAILSEHTTSMVDSGTSCLETVQAMVSATHPPDVIFLDVQLQDLPGTEVLKQIRTLTDYPKVIMVSGNTEQEVRGIDPAFRPDFFLEKPFDSSSVQFAVESVLGSGPGPHAVQSGE